MIGLIGDALGAVVGAIATAARRTPQQRQAAELTRRGKVARRQRAAAVRRHDLDGVTLADAELDAVAKAWAAMDPDR